MTGPTRTRRLSAAGVAFSALAAGALAAACDSLLHDGMTVKRGDCATCHLDEYKTATQPVHVDALPLDCAKCHDESAWSPAHGFEHTNDFPLRGAHVHVACAACHTKGYGPSDTPTACVDCHRDDYEGAKAPPHDGYPTRCETCHDENGWKPSRFEHEWPLTGAHVTTACASCHVGDPPVYEGTSGACVSCHRDDYDSSPYPGHQAFATTCEKCHTTTGWKPAIREHKWPLTGAHANAQCASCHLGDPPVYQGTSTACVSCHRDDYDRSPYPGHDAFPTTCQDCHTTTAFRPASGGHPESRFPIARGAHSPFDCQSCHDETLGPNGKDNTDCVGCHTGEHTRARMDDKHKEVSGYPSGTASPHFCLECHPRGTN